MRHKTDVVFAGSAWPVFDPDVGFPGMTREQIVDLNETALCNASRCSDSPCSDAKASRLSTPIWLGRSELPDLFDQQVEILRPIRWREPNLSMRMVKTLARRSAAEGEGLIVADVDIERVTPQTAPCDAFWISGIIPCSERTLVPTGCSGAAVLLEHCVPVSQGEAIGPIMATPALYLLSYSCPT